MVSRAAVALAVMLSVVGTGTGLPMCVSLLAQAGTPCEMHPAHHGSRAHQHAAPSAALVAQTPDQACHQDATGLGCAAGTACPTAGPATPTWAKVAIALRTASRFGAGERHAALTSYLAPPLAPPPQA